MASPSPYALPGGWNTSQNVYALQYHNIAQRKLALVKMIVIDKELLITAMVSHVTLGCTYNVSYIRVGVLCCCLQLASDMETVYSTTLETDRYIKTPPFNSVRLFIALL